MYVKLNASGFPYFIEKECATCGIDVGVLHINSIFITNVLLRLEHSFTKITNILEILINQVHFYLRFDN